MYNMCAFDLSLQYDQSAGGVEKYFRHDRE